MLRDEDEYNPSIGCPVCHWTFPAMRVSMTNWPGTKARGLAGFAARQSTVLITAAGDRPGPDSIDISRASCHPSAHSAATQFVALAD